MDLETNKSGISKIIALLPYKNEEWILKTYLSNVKNVADEIVCIDDLSTDTSNKIMTEGGAYVELNTEKPQSGWAEYNIRQRLLELGRQRGGTHFICLDADEIFEDAFCKVAREKINALKPGESYMLKWITAWKDLYTSRIDGVYKVLYKDFIFCDDGTMSYPYAFLGVKRTPQSTKPAIQLEYSVLHLQYYNYRRNQIKQAWYMCSERIKNARNIRRINLTYSIKNDLNIKTEPILPDTYPVNFVKPDIEFDIKSLWHWKEIEGFFKTYGIAYFEGLDIWSMPELEDRFISEMGREPKVETFPTWLVKLNSIRHATKDMFAKLSRRA